MGYTRGMHGQATFQIVAAGAFAASLFFAVSALPCDAGGPGVGEEAKDVDVPSRPEAIMLFDGESLEGWATVGTAQWRVEEGVLKGGQDGDPGRSGLIMTRRHFRDFDLTLEFRIDEHGKYNSGVYLRHDPERRGNRGYQVNLGRAAAEEYTGLYLDDWLDKGDEHDTVRKPLEWNHLRVKAVGARIEVWLNQEKIVDYTDPSPKPELLRSGAIALQTYGAEGHAGWVHFRGISVVDLAASDATH